MHTCPALTATQESSVSYRMLNANQALTCSLKDTPSRGTKDLAEIKLGAVTFTIEQTQKCRDQCEFLFGPALPAATTLKQRKASRR